jgi:hypothetical protein
MFKLLATLATMLSLSIQSDTVTVSVGPIWAEIEISTGNIVEWGT